MQSVRSKRREDWDIWRLWSKGCSCSEVNMELLPQSGTFSKVAYFIDDYFLSKRSKLKLPHTVSKLFERISAAEISAPCFSLVSFSPDAPFKIKPAREGYLGVWKFPFPSEQVQAVEGHTPRFGGVHDNGVPVSLILSSWGREVHIRYNMLGAYEPSNYPVQDSVDSQVQELTKEGKEKEMNEI